MSATEVSKSAVPVQLRRNRFDPERVRLLRRGNSLLVIDRLSGRWTVRPQEEEPILRLLGTELTNIPESVRPLANGMRQMLADEKIGIAQSQDPHENISTLIVKMTSACNLACTYCYDYDAEEHGTRIDLAGTLTIIDEALSLASTELWIILHGGEPMLAWSAIEKLVCESESLAAKSGKTIRFTGQSNMTRLTAHIVQFSRDHDIVWGVSIDGPPDLHDAARVGHRGQGSYALFEQSLQSFPHFVKSCAAMSTITALNQHRLIDVVSHVRNIGLNSWDWSLFQPIGRGRDDFDVHELDVDTVLEGWSSLFDAVESGSFDGFRVAPVTKYLNNFVSGPGANMCMRSDCGAGRDLMSLSADGTIEACDCIDPRGPLGNLGHIATTSLAEARASTTNQIIRSRNVGATQCRDCLWFGVCGGTCLAHAGSVESVWDLGCELAKLAFDRISASIVEGDRLLRYLRSLE